MPTLVNNLRAIRGPVTAVPMVGASGVVVEADTANNQVVVRADETVLYENPTFASGDVALGTTFQLSESAANFERIRISWSRWSEADVKTDGNDCTEHDMKFGSVTRNRVTAISLFYAGPNESTAYLCGSMLTGFNDGTTITCARGWQSPLGTTNVNREYVYYRPWKVVGINRIANS